MDKEALESIDLEGETEDFAALLEESFKDEESESGERLVDGVIVQISEDSVLVDIGMKLEGRIHPAEITNEDGTTTLVVGDKITVLYTGSQGERPKISYKKAQRREKARDFIKENISKEEPVDIEGVLTKKNAGGFLVEGDGIDFFLPSSLSGFKYDVNPVGKAIVARVIKMNEENASIIVSRRAYLNAVRKKRREIIKKLITDNEVVEGTVNRIKSYGMFVDVDGVEGLVHYSEISYKGPVNPSTIYKVGDKVEVKAIDYDKDKKRLALSIKATQINPWEEIAEQLEVGDAVKVHITNMENYGVFVDLGNEIEGFLHISEISWKKNIKHPSEVLTLDDEIDVEVIELDVKNQRLRVSLKRLQSKPIEEFVEKYKIGQKVNGEITSIKDFGAFVRLDEVEGLLHNEDASWEKKDTCKNLFKVGDFVDVVITKIDPDKERISLSRKQLIESPLETFAKEHKIGDIITGEVRDKKDFGLFIKLNDEIDGLIRVEDLGNVKMDDLEIGSKIESVITLVDTQRNRIRLSCKKLAKQREREMVKEYSDNHKDGDTALGDAFKALRSK